MTLDIDTIEARANAATPARWFVHEGMRLHGGGVFVQIAGNERQVACATGQAAQDDNRASADAIMTANAVFIAHAREDVPALVAEVRRQRAELELVNSELGALQWAATRMLDVLRGSSVRCLRAILARSLRNADRTGIKRKGSKGGSDVTR